MSRLSSLQISHKLKGPFSNFQPIIYHFLQQRELKTTFPCSLSLIEGPLSGVISSLCWVSLPFSFSQQLVMNPLSDTYCLTKHFLSLNLIVVLQFVKHQAHVLVRPFISMRATCCHFWPLEPYSVALLLKVKPLSWNSLDTWVNSMRSIFFPCCRCDGWFITVIGRWLEHLNHKSNWSWSS